MAKTMPGVESFDVHDATALDRERQDPARPRRPEDEDRHGEGRGARAGVRSSSRSRATGVGAMISMQTSFDLAERRRRGHADELGGRREDRRPGRLDGPAGAAADRQPAGSARALHALDREVQERGRGRSRVAVPFRIGVMQLTMEPLEEMLASARAMDAAASTRSGSPRRTRGGASTGWRRARRRSCRR